MLAAVLLAANLIAIRMAAKLGRVAGAAAGLFGFALSIGLPCVLAILLGMGEGPAFITLLAGLVGVAAVLGAISGFCSAGQNLRNASPTGTEPIVAEVIDPEVGNHRE